MNKEQLLIMLGAMAGSEMFYVVPKLYPGDKYQLRHDILDDGGVYNSDRMQNFVPLKDCIILARSIESLTPKEGRDLIRLHNPDAEIIHYQFDGEFIQCKIRDKYEGVYTSYINVGNASAQFKTLFFLFSNGVSPKFEGLNMEFV